MTRRGPTLLPFSLWALLSACGVGSLVHATTAPTSGDASASSSSDSSAWSSTVTSSSSDDPPTTNATATVVSTSVAVSSAAVTVEGSSSSTTTDQSSAASASWFSGTGTGTDSAAHVSTSGPEEAWRLPPGMEWVLLGVLIVLILIAILIASCLVCKERNIQPCACLTSWTGTKHGRSSGGEDEETAVAFSEVLAVSEEESTKPNKPVIAVQPLKNSAANDPADLEGSVGGDGDSAPSSSSSSAVPQPTPRRTKLRISPDGPPPAQGSQGEGEGERRRSQVTRNRKSVYSMFRHSLTRLDKVQTYLVDRLEFGQLEDDFKAIPVAILELSRDASLLPENRKKNRFASILPYDKNRVVLTDGYTEDEATDYINASYIDGHSSEKAYIAAQGPKDTTVGDFWRMIWQEKITQIVMLTNLKERGRDKCQQYWPEGSGQLESHGPLTVTTDSVESRATFTVRAFTLTKGQESREVTQYHYVAWPDFGVPLTASLVSFWRYVTRRGREEGGQGAPLLVHCSAGVGRSGTYIGLDLAMQRCVTQGDLDLVQLVTSLRHQRCLMVQASSQFEFLHTALLESYSSRDSIFPVEDMNSLFTSPINALQPHARIDNEFKMVVEMNALTHSTRCTIARKEGNSEKNRNPLLLPDDDHIAFLNDYVEGRGDYINAVFVPTFHDARGSLMTQLPLPSTLVDFWRLVHGNRVSAILSLCSPDEEKDIDPPCQFWPMEMGREMEVAPYSLSLQSTSPVSASCLSYTLCLRKQGAPESREVRLLHYQGWKGRGAGDVEEVLQIVDVLRTLTSSSSSSSSSSARTYLVQCTDGVRKSGLFCALLDVIDRMTYDQQVDVYMSVRHIQSVCPHAVSNVIQYRYLYEAAQTRSAQTSLYANSPPLSPSALQSLS